MVLLEEQIIDSEEEKVNIAQGESLRDIHKFIKIRLVVEDSGVGIKKENLSKVFGDYSRLDEHQKMNAKGTGLGMSIGKKIIE